MFAALCRRYRRIRYEKVAGCPGDRAIPGERQSDEGALSGKPATTDGLASVTVRDITFTTDVQDAKPVNDLTSISLSQGSFLHPCGMGAGSGSRETVHRPVRGLRWTIDAGVQLVEFLRSQIPALEYLAESQLHQVQPAGAVES